MKKKAASTGSQWANQFLNPLARDEELLVNSPNKLTQALTHAGSLAVGYGGLALVMRKLQQAGSVAPDTKDREKRQAYIKARYPTMKFLEEKEGTGASHASHLALAAAAMVIGGYGGYRMADDIVTREETEDIDQRMDDTRSKTNDLIQSEYDRTRGLNKSAEWDVSGGEGMGVLGKAKSWGSQAYVLWAAATMALGYAGAKSFTDANDPNRERLETLKDLAKNRAKASRAPVLAASSGIRSSGKSLAPGDSNKDMRSIGVGSGTQVDPEDPYAGILG